MKLLKPELCLCKSGGGNVKTQATLVEVQGIGFRTGVRLPSSPLEAVETNPAGSTPIGLTPLTSPVK